MKLFLFFWALTFLSPAQTFTPDNRPSFEKRKIKVGESTLNVEVADESFELSYGLMFKKEWKDIEGMLFIFPNEKKRSFWMKNTYLPLSLGFFNAKGVLNEIHHMTPPKSVFHKKISRVQSEAEAKYVLEVPKGWFENQNVKKGTKLKDL